MLEVKCLFQGQINFAEKSGLLLKNKTQTYDLKWSLYIKNLRFLLYQNTERLLYEVHMAMMQGSRATRPRI